MTHRALIFDDDPSIRQILWAVCDRRGYEVFTFPHPGLCPLHRRDLCPCDAESTCSDVIVSDLDMPSVKGLDFVEALRGKGCHCRHIALISGAWSEHDMARARELNCKLFTKPFEISEIMDWLADVERTLLPTRKLHHWSSLGSPP